jgi:serine-type D-Ala-D-Ala carboxypeptidase (penicillin-binding protein 5/6)
VAEGSPPRHDDDTKGATPLPPAGEHEPVESQGPPSEVIHLGANRRATAQGLDVGELAPYSQTASGLSALGRAQARAQRSGPEDPPGPENPVASPVPDGSDRPPGPTGRPRRTRRAQRRERRWRTRGGGRSRRAGRAGRRGLHRSRRSRRLVRATLIVVVAAAAIVALAAGFVAVQLRRSAPRPVLQSSVPAPVTVAGPVPRVPWPRSGESAVAVTGVGTVGSAGPSSRVPIASLAKVMTAAVVLRDHPLAKGQSGPGVIVSAVDQAVYRADEAAGDSVAPVVAGETLTELQLLEGLLIPSADNLAPVAARWDAGSQAAFVTKMNVLAATLGMTATRYADPGGVSATTVSTAADQLRLAETVSANPVFMSIVRQPQLTLPDSPELFNYNTILGHDGIVGIKTGATAAAGGCFMFAADASAVGRRVEVLGVVLGQRATPLIPAALHAGETLIGPVVAGLRPVTAVPAGTVVARIRIPWGPSVAVTTARAVTVMHFGPTPVVLGVRPGPTLVTVGLPARAQVATVSVRAGGQVQTVAAVTDQPIQGPSRRWRLERR